MKFQAVKCFFLDEEGLTAVEYVIGAALLAGALLSLFLGYQGTLITKIQSILQ
ncbi:hypothetical protein [Vibrio sp. 10N.286.49.B3]|uniref:hypothetical protein n=1 Tax=Vibrio sp. 10N.286.49.B3 TaxID=1880855 RepID=UPI0018E4058D|nr:hypothetical protein [Vibrio sp. 10N.286.49.B3]